MAKAKAAKPQKFKYVVTLSIETEEKVLKRDIREYITDVLSAMPFDDLTEDTLRIRTVASGLIHTA